MLERQVLVMVAALVNYQVFAMSNNSLQASGSQWIEALLASHQLLRCLVEQFQVHGPAINGRLKHRAPKAD